MKQPELKLLIKQTKKDKMRAEMIVKLIDYFYPKKEWDLRRKWKLIMERERKVNPLGKIFTYWNKKK